MNKKIYIVEDEPLIAETIKTALTKEGYQIIGMSDNAKEALFDIEHLQPELILLDINIEGTIDGIELAGYIKKKCNIPFIFLTSHSDDMTLERVKKMEPAGYIVKPFNEKTLKTNIELAIHKAHAQVQNISSNDSVDSIFIKNKGELIKIQLEDIYYLEAYDNYCFFAYGYSKKLVELYFKKCGRKITFAEIYAGSPVIHHQFIQNKITTRRLCFYGKTQNSGE
jgi:DNA-binding LytR/AlgR family response regulator